MKPYNLLKLPALLKAKEQMPADNTGYLLVVADNQFTATVVTCTQAGLPLTSVDSYAQKAYVYLKQELYAIYDVVQEGMNE